MNGRALEHTLLHATFFADLKVFHLQDDAKALHEEDAAEQRKQQFLVYDHRQHADDASDGEAACVAHKYLRRIGVVPQETYKCTNESAAEDHEFLRSGDVHNVQVACKLDMARHIAQAVPSL